MAAKCAICGAKALTVRHGEFRFCPPPRIPGGDIVVLDAEWEECESCGEQIILPALEAALEAERYQRLGLLQPTEIKAIRKRMRLTQTEMAQLIGVGEKTYTRWESGRSIQNKSSDNLIRFADTQPELFVQLDARRSPGREKLISEYVANLYDWKGSNPPAMVAHGADVGPARAEALRRCLRGIAKDRGKG